MLVFYATLMWKSCANWCRCTLFPGEVELSLHNNCRSQITQAMISWKPCSATVWMSVEVNANKTKENVSQNNGEVTKKNESFVNNDIWDIWQISISRQSYSELFHRWMDSNHSIWIIFFYLPNSAVWKVNIIKSAVKCRYL